jgi:hypothetical protein
VFPKTSLTRGRINASRHSINAIAPYRQLRDAVFDDRGLAQQPLLAGGGNCNPDGGRDTVRGVITYKF